MLDFYDEKGNLLGTRTKKEVLNEQKTISLETGESPFAVPVIHLLLSHPEKGIYTVQRANKSENPYLWCKPVGGHISSGETEDSTLIREGQEEIKTDIILANSEEEYLNLISNDVKYNKPGGSVEVSFGEQEGDKIRIGIRDTGRGIPSDKKDRIFEPFERFDTDIENIEGTGVGLTISKQLVEMMGGTIGFETAYGEGSFFYFDIPISDKTIAPLETEIPPDLIPAPLPKPHDRTVLYIDDTPTNLQLVQQILSHRKHIKLLTAPSARLGIELAQAEIPDLILMDIQMPEMDGLEAFKRLEDIKETQSIPVIALTAYAMDADIKKAAEIGFKDYISKPIDVYKFLNTMDKLL